MAGPETVAEDFISLYLLDKVNEVAPIPEETAQEQRSFRLGILFGGLQCQRKVTP